ncbi:hypothetical protein ACFZB9_30385 [Kitasatospora sp. NPDC008050]|uniref:hypothetical protein n=1 Tax=Kitasatospora sp. NPDC008050 TaxID=3364021 RepID=UPI0036E0B24F
MRQMLRGYVELAAGLAEAAGKRVVGTAVELLERAGVDVEGAERAVTTQLPPAVQKLETLAQEVVTVGRGGLDLAVGLARAEAEKAVERVGKLGDQVVKIGVVLAYLEGKLHDLEGDGRGSAEAGAEQAERAHQESAGSTSGAAKPGRAESLFAADWQPEADQEAEPGLDSEPDWELETGAAGWYTPPEPAAEAPTPRKRPAKTAAVKKSAAVKKTAAPEKAAPEKAAAKKTAAAKAPVVKKAVAKKTGTAKKATKTAATKTTAKKTTPKKPAGERDV